MMLCGIDINTDATNDAFYDTLLDINGLGASRATADMTSNKQSGSWGIIMASCIKRLVPFTMTLLMTGNIDWVAKIGQGMKVITIQFPAEAGFSAGVKLEFSAVVTSVTLGGSIEGRTQINVQITPSGVPTLTPAVAV